MLKQASTVALFIFSFFSASQSVADIFKDRDWNHSFERNCATPNGTSTESSIQWWNEEGARKLLFTLHQGQPGGCPSDKISRHRARFWERVEVAQEGKLDPSVATKIQFEMQIHSGFVGKRETFFQIHSWNPKCDAYPPLMMKMHKKKLQFHLLRGVRIHPTSDQLIKKGSHKIIQLKKNRSAKYLRREPQKVEILLSKFQDGIGTVSIDINGTRLVKDATLELAKCAQPHVQFGIYRPNGSEHMSQISFDKVVITEIID